MTREQLEKGNEIKGNKEVIEYCLEAFKNKSLIDSNIFYYKFYGRTSDRDKGVAFEIRKNAEGKKYILCETHGNKSMRVTKLLSDKSQERIIKMYEMLETVVKDCFESELNKLESEFNKL